MKRTASLIILLLLIATSASAMILAGVMSSSQPPPNAPTGVTAGSWSQQNTVSWTNGTGATSHNLLWDAVSHASSGTYANTITGVTSPYLHTGLTNGITYYYKVQAANSAGTADSSEVNATPNPPAPYTFDGTAGAAPESAFTVTTAGGGTGTLDGAGSLKINTTANAGGAIAFLSSPITVNSVHKYRVRFKASPSIDSSGFNILAIKYDSGAAGSPGTFGYPLIPAIVNVAGSAKLLVRYYDATSTPKYWDNSSGAWITSDVTSRYSITSGNWYWFELITDATGFSYKLYDAGTSTTVGTTLATTTQIAWSGVAAASGTPRIVLGGDYLTDNAYGTMYFDTFVVE